LTPKQLLYLIIIVALIRGILYLKSFNIPANTLKVVNEYLESIVIAGAVALVLIKFVVQTFYIPSESMIPTLQVKDRILVNEFIYRFKQPQRLDIVVFKPPPAANSDDKDFIKRIVALAGETLEVKEGKVLINGKPLDEPYIAESPYYNYEAVKIPPENYFVMGDNRNNSDDSHVWGFLPKKNLIGKAMFIYWPFTRMHYFSNKLLAQ
jgi:signal peptidase I